MRTLADQEAPKGKQWKNLFTYAIIMLVAVMIVILIAAMADDREKELGAKINETEETYESAQRELVALKDENYSLKKENEKLNAAQADRNHYNMVLGQLTEVWQLYSTGNLDAAVQKLALIDTAGMDQVQKGYYDALNALLTVPPAVTPVPGTTE